MLCTWHLIAYPSWTSDLIWRVSQLRDWVKIHAALMANRGMLTALYFDVSLPAFVAPTGLLADWSTQAQHTCPPERVRFSHLDFQETAMAPMNGTIKRLVSDKGFGFILASDGNEYFFHNSACSETRFDDLREGQAVTFERGEGPKGPRGENVRVVG